MLKYKIKLKNIYTLIQSGGGTGPMKPGNRLLGMVPNPAGIYLGDKREQ